MTNEERDRLLAWLDEQVKFWESRKEAHFEDEYESGYEYSRGVIVAYTTIKAHLQAESESHDQAEN